MTDRRETEKQIAYMEYLNRENQIRHHYYEEELKQYRLMQAGDPSAIDESARMMKVELHGTLSENPLRSVKYLFVANITLTTRFAIEGGMDSETAYNTSDLFINRMDHCSSVEEVLAMHREMFTFFTDQMAMLQRKSIFALPILQAMDYIDEHLHERITVEQLAAYLKLNPSYLSTLFSKEMGIPLSDYIQHRRIDVAKRMLLDSNMSGSEISSILAFSSQSHFIRVFQKETGMTPKHYREVHFRKGIRAADSSPLSERKDQNDQP